MKLIVAGSRNYTDKEKVFKCLDILHNTIPITCIISGLAKGPDLFGKQWAISRGVPVEEFPADWDTYGKRAGYMRNEQMAAHGTHLLAFWDGASRGTGHMIGIAKNKGLQVKVVN